MVGTPPDAFASGAFAHPTISDRVRRPREACSAVSQVTFRPDSAHLLVGRESAAIRLRKGLVKRRLFFGTQLKQRLIFTGQLQEHACEFVLYFRRKAAYRFDGLFKQFGHAWTIELLPAARKDFEGNRDRDHSEFNRPVTVCKEESACQKRQA
jgi:hypothetical protein